MWRAIYYKEVNMVVVLKYLSGHKREYRDIKSIILTNNGYIQMKERAGLRRRFKVESIDYYFITEET